jgi:hypothetical protein
MGLPVELHANARLPAPRSPSTLNDILIQNKIGFQASLSTVRRNYDSKNPYVDRKGFIHSAAGKQAGVLLARRVTVARAARFWRSKWLCSRLRTLKIAHVAAWPRLHQFLSRPLPRRKLRSSRILRSGKAESERANELDREN